MSSHFEFLTPLLPVTAVNILGPLIEGWNRTMKNPITVEGMYDAQHTLVWPTPRPSIYHDLDVTYTPTAPAVQFTIQWKHTPTEEEVAALAQVFESVGRAPQATSLHP